MLIVPNSTRTTIGDQSSVGMNKEREKLIVHASLGISMDLRQDRLIVSRELSALDRDVISFTSILTDLDIPYVIVSGYVTILTGRSRSTEDIDIILGTQSDDDLQDLADRLSTDGYWGMAMPLNTLTDMLTNGDRFRVADQDELFPNFEIWLASNDLEREALSSAIIAELNDNRIRISSIELQIAYKLRLAKGAGTTTGKDFEDALHLYLTFKDQFNNQQLESYIEQLGVTTYYAELRRV